MGKTSYEQMAGDANGCLKNVNSWLFKALGCLLLVIIGMYYGIYRGIVAIYHWVVATMESGAG